MQSLRLFAVLLHFFCAPLSQKARSDRDRGGVVGAKNLRCTFLFLFIGFGAPDHRDGETRKANKKPPIPWNMPKYPFLWNRLGSYYPFDRPKRLAKRI